MDLLKLCLLFWPTKENKCSEQGRSEDFRIGVALSFFSTRLGDLKIRCGAKEFQTQNSVKHYITYTKARPNESLEL